MVKYSRLVFPFRSITFFSLYIILNTLLYSSSPISRNHVYNLGTSSYLSNPLLPDDLRTYVTANYMQLPIFKSYQNNMKGWIGVADFFIIFLFACLVLGFLTNSPHVSIVISVLHFIGIVLCTLFSISYGSINYLICGVTFGIILPALIEIVNIIGLFVFKTDFYIPRN
ncbi:hypothetical protein TRFO_22731 [Tritrichomonas foetus]|uniref:Uncharacterized protein n=1 Tax=Tritrichomonas foetus TaxID=1144522 RepID=A0A1J4KCE2_9EUKA|nr:hypothetical protein TRFO_22731 [Tritrichomonas foetus]|eukprot:OHT08650.1 hypothetical protein TRFO_22731 [Tritrichomonas foetus]